MVPCVSSPMASLTTPPNQQIKNQGVKPKKRNVLSVSSQKEQKNKQVGLGDKIRRYLHTYIICG